MEIGKEYALGSLVVGDCVEFTGKRGIVLGRNPYYVYMQYEKDRIAGYSENTAVKYLGKGKVTVEFPKQYTLEDAANTLKEFSGASVYFIKLDKDKLIVYHSKKHMPSCTSSLGFPIEYVCVPDNKVLK